MLLFRHSIVPLMLLLGSACSDTGGAGTETGSTTSTGSTTDTDAADSETSGTTTSGEPGTTTEAPTEGSATSSTTSTGTSSTTSEPDTDTDAETMTDTTAEPMPVTCDGMPVPEPVNEELTSAELVHVPGEQRYYLHLAAESGDSTWELQFELGAEEPVAGTWTELAFEGEAWLEDIVGGSTFGTATLELIVVTPECVLGRVSEVVEDPEWFVAQELPGGFFATRETL